MTPRLAAYCAVIVRQLARHKRSWPSGRGSAPVLLATSSAGCGTASIVRRRRVSRWAWAWLATSAHSLRRPHSARAGLGGKQRLACSQRRRRHHRLGWSDVSRNSPRSWPACGIHRYGWFPSPELVASGRPGWRSRRRQRLASTFRMGCVSYRWRRPGPRLVAPLVARALGVNPTREPVADLIKMRLGGRRVLLVLDTFEHVLDAAPFVADLLASCSGLTVLATSRAALRLRGAAIGDSHRAAVLAAAAAAIRK